MKFQKTISKQDIQTFIESKNSPKTKITKNIQELKENSIHRLKESFSNENFKFIDPMLIKDVEKEYLNLLKTSQGNINPNIDTDKYRREIEGMFKKETFEKNYIETFQNYSNNKYIETPKQKLFQRKTYLMTHEHDQREEKELQDINKILGILQEAKIENTRSRDIFFDENKYISTKDKFNCQCFFEQDLKGNKNYFSLNELLNDLETFGVECGYPKINKQGLSNDFHNAQKFIKVALLKNILAKYRDYQEVMMYNFIDYEKEEKTSEYGNKNGILAEKVVERYFRNLANKDNRFNIKVEKASIGEDQNHKVDLIIKVKDKQTGINIKKELQLTLNHNPEILENKKLQIIKQKQTREVDIDLLELELNMLEQKVNLRKKLKRPIGGIYEFLSLEDKEFLEETYKKITTELINKQEKIK